MRIIKADIVGHWNDKASRQSIYSIDFQPNGHRLASGGGDCCLKLWDVISLLSSPNVAKDSLLATLTTHSKSVNVVRWSIDGKYIASGSDDTYIIIYKYTPERVNMQSFGSKPCTNKESWSRCFTCQGHSMDILDMQWSPRGILASSSIDNTVMIWNPISDSSHAMFSSVLTPIRTLRGHQSFVRGVAFDATGKYLASSGIDNIVLLWDADNNFKEIRRVKTPVKDSPDTSLFRRMDWAPDGLLLCISAALKSGKPIGNVIKRKTWEIAADLVGHTAATSCCRFSPQLFRPMLPSKQTDDNSSKVKKLSNQKSSHSEPVIRKPSNDLEPIVVDPSTVDMAVSSQSTVRQSLRLRGVSAPTTESSDDDTSSDTTNSNSSDESSQANTKTGFKLKSSALSCVVALGDQAGVLSIWGSHSNRALLVLRDVFEGPVTDISWVNNANQFVDTTHGRVNNELYTQTIFACCGLDGSVVIVDLEGEVLGEIVSKGQDSFNKHIQTLYGKSYDEIVFKSAQDPIVQDGAIGGIQPSHVSAVDRRGPIDSVSFQFNSQSDQRLPVTLQDSSPSTANVKALQVQTKTKDGKKRIQPVLLQDNGNISQSYFDGSLLSDTVVPPTHDDYDPCRRNCDNTLDMNGNIEFGLKSKSGGLSVNKRAGSDNSDQKKRLRQQSVPYISMDNWVCTIPRPLRDSGNSVWIVPIGTDITQNMGYDAQTKSLTSIVDEITLQLRESDGSISTELSVTMKHHDQATDADPSEGILSTRISGIANIDSEVTCVAVADAHASHLLLNMTHFTNKEINFIVYGTISGRLDVLSLITGASMLAGQLVLGGPVCSLHTCRKPDGGDSCVYSVLAMTADGEIWMWDLMPLSQAESSLKCVLKVSTDAIVKSLSVCNRVLKVGRGILDIDKDTSVKIVSCGLTNQGCVKVVAETSRTDRSETFMYSTDCQAWITCERS